MTLKRVSIVRAVEPERYSDLNSAVPVCIRQKPVLTSRFFYTDRPPVYKFVLILPLPPHNVNFVRKNNSAAVVLYYYTGLMPQIDLLCYIEEVGVAIRGLALAGNWVSFVYFKLMYRVCIEGSRGVRR